MFIKCSSQHCSGRIEFDEAYVGLPIVCPHCGSETKLLPDSPSQTSLSQPEIASSNLTVGTDVLPGPWMDEPMSEKQRAMLVLYGIGVTEGLTKGEASMLIDQAKQSGVHPTERNSKEAGKLFDKIDRQERKDRLKRIAEIVADATKAIQRKKATISQLEALKDEVEDVFQELTEAIENRIADINQEECDRENKEFDDT